MTVTEKPDTALLIHKLKRDDIRAFNLLFELYSSKLYHFALGYLKSKEESEELVQEIFTRIWEKRAAIDPEQSFDSYLFTIAFNHIRKFFRSRAILNKYIDFTQQQQPAEPVASPEVSYRALSELVEQLVGQMPEKRRLVFRKSRFEGKPISEIAREMGISTKTAENHLHTALKFLRQELAKEYLIGLLFFYLLFF